MVDSCFSDRTAEVAAARVVHHNDVLGHLKPLSGKGEALRKGLWAARGDVVAFIDADLIGCRRSSSPGCSGRCCPIRLNLHWPLLSRFVQPLAGEFAGRLEVLEAVPFATQYGVEIGLLVDLLCRRSS